MMKPNDNKNHPNDLSTQFRKKPTMKIRPTIITILAFCTVLWAIPRTAPAQVQGGNLLLSNNIGGVCNTNGGSSIFEYTPQYIPLGRPETIFASNLHAPRKMAFDSTGNLFVATNTPDDSCVTAAAAFYRMLSSPDVSNRKIRHFGCRLRRHRMQPASFSAHWPWREVRRYSRPVLADHSDTWIAFAG